MSYQDLAMVATLQRHQDPASLGHGIPRNFSHLHSQPVEPFSSFSLFLRSLILISLYQECCLETLLDPLPGKLFFFHTPKESCLCERGGEMC